MPLLDVTRPEVIKFLNESIEKTTALRMRWNLLHKDKLNEAAGFIGEEKGYRESDVCRSVFKAGMAASTRDNISASYNRRELPSPSHIPGIKDLKKEHSIANTGLGDPKDDTRLERPDDDLSLDPLIRPIPPNQEEILYKELPSYGRNAYLKARYRTKPEEKFYHEVTTSHDYGWRLNDSYFEKNSPNYPRLGQMEECLKNRYGLQPDPQHYQSSDAILQSLPCSSYIP